MDISMDNWTQITEQNVTFGMLLCSGPYFTATTFVFVISALLSFITSLIVMVELLKRINKNGFSGSSPTEVFLLQINLINVCDAIALVMHFLNRRGVLKVNVYIFMILNHPVITAEPLFLFGICMSIYYAVVHPVTYMALKNGRHWQWIFITLVWLYALIMEVVCFSYKLFLLHPVHILALYIVLPAIVFFNVCILMTLDSSGPENKNQVSNPAKRKAFRIVLSILVVIIVYGVPQVCYITFRFIAPTDLYWYECYEKQMILIPPALSQIVMPGIFIYSVGRVGE